MRSGHTWAHRLQGLKNTKKNNHHFRCSVQTSKQSAPNEICVSKCDDVAASVDAVGIVDAADGVAAVDVAAVAASVVGVVDVAV